MSTQPTEPREVRVVKDHRVEFWPTGFGGFYGAKCLSCDDKLIAVGFPMSYISHAAEHHAGACECAPDLTTWT